VVVLVLVAAALVKRRATFGKNIANLLEQRYTNYVAHYLGKDRTCDYTWW
jgi:hypothetical protein